MALAPLATTADLTARGVTIDPAETVLVDTYLEVASTAVRDAAGSPISQTTSTVVLEGEPVQRLRLPGGPVVSVGEVLVDGEPVTEFRLRSGALWRACGWQDGCGPSEVTVTYTHGLAEVPADIVDLVCRLAAGALMSSRSAVDGEHLAARPVVSERIGDYSVTYAHTEAVSEVELPRYLRDRLAARFGSGAGSVVRSR